MSRSAPEQLFKPRQVSATGPMLQRKCSCGATAAGGESSQCDECREKMLQRRACANGNASQPPPLPPALRGLPISQPSDRLEREADRAAEGVLRSAPDPRSAKLNPVQSAPGSGLSGGQALSPQARSFYEPRFGYDFSKVRIHSGDEAARVARSVNAAAFTVGSDIVFGASRFQPANAEGRSLLAHELAHVVQQRGGSAELKHQSNPMIQRQCVPSPYPPVSVEIGSYPPTPKQAEVCLQEQYAATPGVGVPGVSLGFNKSWTTLAGSSKEERAALTCLRGGTTARAGVNFTAKGGKAAAEPDIWDFKIRTMYEITTASQLDFKSGETGKLAAQIELANELTSNYECGLLTFSPGGWAPLSPCYLLPSGLYISAQNFTGVLIYRVLKDVSKELLEVTSLATLAALAAKYGPKAIKGLAGQGGKLGGAVAARAAVVYAIASLAATAILLASGKAEAKIGPGDKEPILQLFEAMAQKGTPVPPEIQKMIEDDPELKASIDKAVGQSGDVSEAQNQINQKILKIINDNKDQFTKEDLEAVLTATGVAGKALPDSNLTAEKVRKMIDKAKAGDIDQGDGSGDGSGAGKDNKNVWERAKEGSGSQPKPQDKPAEKANVWDKAKYPGLKDETVQKIVSAPPPVRGLVDALLGEKGVKLTDDVVDKVLAAIPPDLTPEESQAMMGHLTPVDDKTTVDDVIKSLKDDLTQTRQKKAKAEEDSAEAAVVNISPDPKDAGKPSANAADIRAKLAATAKSGDYSRVSIGQSVLFWGEEKQGVIHGTLKGKDVTGNRYAGRVTAKITKRSGGKLDVLITAATDWVYADGTVYRNAASIAGKPDTIVVMSRPK